MSQSGADAHGPGRAARDGPGDALGPVVQDRGAAIERTEKR
jgi:hypothetical protein